MVIVFRETSCTANEPGKTGDVAQVIVHMGGWGFPKIRGPIFGSPHNKSPTILGYILGPLIFGVSQLEPWQVGLGQPNTDCRDY